MVVLTLPRWLVGDGAGMQVRGTVLRCVCMWTRCLRTRCAPHPARTCRSLPSKEHHIWPRLLAGTCTHRRCVWVRAWWLTGGGVRSGRAHLCDPVLAITAHHGT